MSKVLLIGSGNRDKRAELEQLLADSTWTVKSLADFDAIAEPEETEETFAENALLKAHYYGTHYGVACVADDSGIEVDALGGAPGVYSARYAGEDCSYEDNNRKLLEALAKIEPDKRGARFVSCAAFVDVDGTEHVELGTVSGRIAQTDSGSQGFGYDPIFIPDGSDKTFGEFTKKEKAAISHRGESFRAMCEYLFKREV
ncbi:MAG: RdgB/HAM1 family non-canonical purine NTP pyrophosphatase [Candidatus Hydrogenedentota bacterium]